MKKGKTKNRTYRLGVGLKGPLVALFCLMTLAQCTPHREGVSPDDEGGNNRKRDPVSFGDGAGDVSPPREEEPIPHDPGEDLDCDGILNTVVVSPTEINFGLGQVGQTQCQTISVDRCLTYSVEIHSTSDRSTIQNDDGEPEEVPEFFLQLEGAELSKLDGISGSIEVCYRRGAVPLDNPEWRHEGRVNVIIGGNGASSAYAIPLRGRTVGPIFGISKPSEGQLVWEGGEIISHNAETSEFIIQVQGTLNPALAGILTNREVTISVGSNSTTVNADNFSLNTTVGIPDTCGPYTVNFSINTTKGLLTKDVGVIRFCPPDATVEIRTTDGTLVSSMAEEETPQTTDSDLLKAGIYIRNLDSSGPTDEHPVTIKAEIIKPNGNRLVFANNDESDPWESASGASAIPIPFYLEDFPFGSSPGVDGKCSGGFPEPMTYCIPMPRAFDLGKGINRLRAKLCNLFTGDNCVYAEAKIIVNNDLPRITVLAPTENQVYGLNRQVILQGIIENYKKDGIQKQGSQCVASTVNLWLNSSTTTTTPTSFPICPSTAVGDIDDDDTGNSGNIKRGTFVVNLSLPPYSRNLALYTNLIRIRAESAIGHVTLKTVAFQRGQLNESTMGRTTAAGEGKYGWLVRQGDLTTGRLGTNTLLDGTTQRAPLMIDLSEGTLDETTNATLFRAIEKSIKDNIKATDVETLLTGGPLKKIDANGDCKAAGADDPGEYCVEGERHGTAMERVRALSELNLCNCIASGACDERPGLCDDYEGMYPDGGGTSQIFFDPDDVKDKCGNVQTAAVVFYNQLEHIFAPLPGGTPRSIPGNEPFDECNPNERGDCPYGEWPRRIAGENLDFNTTEIGILKLHKLKLKSANENGEEGHFLDLKLTLEGQNGKPALWGHAVAYNLTTGGSSAQATGFDQTNLEDPTIPIIFNIGRLTVDIKDVVEIKKIKLKSNGYEPFCRDGSQVSSQDVEGAEPCNFDCEGALCSNKVIFHPENIKIIRDGDDIELEAYLNCADQYRQTVYKALNGNDSMPTNWRLPRNIRMPFGCGTTGEIESVLVERNAKLGYDYWLMSDYGNNRAILELIEEILIKTVKNTLACMPTQLVNPLIDSKAFKYPEWVPEDQRDNDLTMAVDNTDGEVTVKLEDDAENPVFTLKPDIKMADILVKDGGLILKLPLTAGANDITASLFSLPRFDDLFDRPFTRNWGYMYRRPVLGFDNDHPLMEVTEQPYLSLSLAIEEVLNAATHLLMKKGPLEILKMFSEETYNDLNDPNDPTPPNNWTVRIDTVILGRLDICDSVDVLSAKLDPSILFPAVSNLFGTGATHLDIKLDKNQPPTLALSPVEGLEDDKHTAQLALGLTNVQVDLKPLFERIQDDGSLRYEVGENVIAKLRLDLVIKLVLRYIPSSRRLEIYLLPLDDTPIYPSVLDSPVYNDEAVVGNLMEQVIKLVWPKLSREFRPGVDSDNDATNDNVPSFAITLPGTLTEMNDSITVSRNQEGNLVDDDGNIVEDFAGVQVEDNTTPPSVGECTDTNRPLYLSDAGSQAEEDDNDDEEECRSWQCRLREGIQGGFRRYNEQRQEAYDLMNEARNEIEQNLHDIGIREVGFQQGFPNIDLDFNNGYLHISSQVNFDPLWWLTDEVSTDYE